MTCHEAREWLSALIDDAIDPPMRAEVEAHVLTCAECGIEIERLRATVGLLRQAEPVRAPAGFVDRVMHRARPVPWYRRFGAWLFLPLLVKLPVHAVGILLLGGLAVLLVNRTPELRHAARVDAPAPPPVSETRPPVSETPPPVSVAPPQPPPTPPAGAGRDMLGEGTATPAPSSRPEEAQVAPAPKAAPTPLATPRETARRKAVSGGIASGTLRADRGESEPSSPSRVAPPPATPPSAATAAPQPAITAQPLRPMAVPPGPRPPMTATPPPPIAAQARPPAAEESVDARRERSQLESKPSAPTVVGRAAATAARPADLTGRLEVRDQNAAVAAVSALLSKVGGGEIGRRQDGADIVVDVLMPEARYDEFVRGLEALGAWSGPGLRQRVMLDAAHVHLPIRIAQ